MDVETIVSLDDGSSTKETTIEIIDAKGYIYAEDGSFLEHREGSDNAFLAKSYSENAASSTNKYRYNVEPEDLEILHKDFTYIAYVVMYEGTDDEEELKCIAFASYNRSKTVGKTWKQLLATGYSSVSNKQELKDTIKISKAKLARKAVISVLLEEDDMTDGAEFWDGTDFLAWGDSESNPYGKIGQNKFDEYKFIEIPSGVYDTYLDSQKKAVYYKDNDKHTIDECEGSHTHISKEKEVKKKDGTTEKQIDKKIKYDIPAKEFEEAKYRTCNNDFYYDGNTTGAKQLKGISATIAAGQSIFWKITKERLTTGESGICKNQNCNVHHKK